MLAHLLALAVGLGSFGLYFAAFFFPEVYRKGDLIWSGVGLFYALVLWFCAGQIRGGLLLGETAGVALLGWLAWQTLSLRRQTTPTSQQTPLQEAWRSPIPAMFQKKTAPQPVVAEPQPTVESATPTTTTESDSAGGLPEVSSSEVGAIAQELSTPAVTPEVTPEALPEVPPEVAAEEPLEPSIPQEEVLETQQSPLQPEPAPVGVPNVKAAPKPRSRTFAGLANLVSSVKNRFQPKPKPKTFKDITPPSISEDEDFEFGDAEPVVESATPSADLEVENPTLETLTPSADLEVKNPISEVSGEPVAIAEITVVTETPLGDTLTQDQAISISQTETGDTITQSEVITTIETPTGDTFIEDRVTTTTESPDGETDTQESVTTFIDLVENTSTSSEPASETPSEPEDIPELKRPNPPDPELVAKAQEHSPEESTEGSTEQPSEQPSEGSTEQPTQEPLSDTNETSEPKL